MNEQMDQDELGGQLVGWLVGWSVARPIYGKTIEMNVMIIYI